MRHTKEGQTARAIAASLKSGPWRAPLARRPEKWTHGTPGALICATASYFRTFGGAHVPQVLFSGLIPRGARHGLDFQDAAGREGRRGEKGGGARRAAGREGRGGREGPGNEKDAVGEKDPAKRRAGTKAPALAQMGCALLATRARRLPCRAGSRSRVRR